MFALVTINANHFKSHLQHLTTSMAVFILFVSMVYVSITGTLVANEDGSFSHSYIFYVTTASVSLLPILYGFYIGWYWIKPCYFVFNNVFIHMANNKVQQNHEQHLTW